MKLPNKYFLLSFGLWGSVSNPVVSAKLEAGLVTHLLVQIPTLVLAGWVLSYAMNSSIPRGAEPWNRGGTAFLLLGICFAVFWMFPRFLDQSLTQTSWMLFKYLSLPLLVGLPLGLAWQRCSFWVKGLVQCNLLSMIWFLSWLYGAAPEQLCNSYLEWEQRKVGEYLFSVFLILVPVLSIRPLLGSSFTLDRSTSAPTRTMRNQENSLEHR